MQKAYYFSEFQVTLLAGLMIEYSVQAATRLNQPNCSEADRRIFIDSAAILAELHKPDEPNTINNIWPDALELEEFDPRARNPRCVHGVPFKDENGKEVPCERCAANWTDMRLKEEDEARKLTGEIAYKDAVVNSGANRDE